MNKRDKAKKVFELIRGACTLKVAKDFLKEKNLPHSANVWDELFEKRVVPALDVGTLTLEHLQDLLRSVEEHGRQHVFLFKADAERAALMLDPGRIARITAEQELQQVALSQLAIDLPEQAQIVDLRFGTCANAGRMNKTFIVKQVEKRLSFQFAGQVKDARTGYLTKTYEPVESRAVNLARLHSDGTLEVRLASHKNSTQYGDTLNAFMAAIRPWYPTDDFDEVPLQKAKEEIWEQREALAQRIRHGIQTVRNDTGTTLSAKKSSPDDNVMSDSAAETSLKSFLEDDGYCESSHIYFKIKENQGQREVPVVLAGAENEFSLPIACTDKDYEYVFEQIRTLNS